MGGGGGGGEVENEQRKKKRGGGGRKKDKKLYYCLRAGYSSVGGAPVQVPGAARDFLQSHLSVQTLCRVQSIACISISARVKNHKNWQP